MLLAAHAKSPPYIPAWRLRRGGGLQSEPCHVRLVQHVNTSSKAMALLDTFRRQAESHVRFFDHLVELVPAKHYVEREEPPANLKYLKKVWRLSLPSTCWPVQLTHA